MNHRLLISVENWIVGLTITWNFFNSFRKGNLSERKSTLSFDSRVLNKSMISEFVAYKILKKSKSVIFTSCFGVLPDLFFMFTKDPKYTNIATGSAPEALAASNDFLSMIF